MPDNVNLLDIMKNYNVGRLDPYFVDVTAVSGWCSCMTYQPATASDDLNTLPKPPPGSPPNVWKPRKLWLFVGCGSYGAGSTGKRSSPSCAS